MSEHLDTTSQRTALIVLAGMSVVLLFCLQITESISGPFPTAIVWFGGMSLATFCLLKAIMPLLDAQRS